jgi:guanylate kinase
MINTPEMSSRRGLMFVLSSPSGAGKTTIARRLLDHDPDLTLSVSMTTRRRRPGEASGRDYFFVSEQAFSDAISKNDFLEWAKVFDHYYGTPKKTVEHALESGTDVLFDIDWQGTQQLGQIARGDLVSVFLFPPSWAELERRLKARAQDTAAEVDKRMSKAAEEISHWAEYDYVIINDDLEKAVQQVESILTAERLKRSRQRGLSDFAKTLIQRRSF